MRAEEGCIDLRSYVAGIAIGLVNTTWSGRLLVPFGWGVMMCIYVFLSGQYRRDQIANLEAQDVRFRWGLSPSQVFYLREYVSATSGSLFFSVLAGLGKGLFS